MPSARNHRLNRTRLGMMAATALLGFGLAIGPRAAEAAAGATTTVTIPTGGGSAPAVTVTTPVIQQSPGTIASAAGRAGSNWASVTVGSTTDSQAMSAGFIGLSLEYGTIERYGAVGPLFDQIVENLTPGQRPVIRIGGASADHVSVPVPGVDNRGIFQTLTPAWMAAAKRIGAGLNARLIPDLDMEIDNPRVPAAEVKEMLADIGARYIPAFELGNEPGLYSQFAWYKVGDKAVLARSPTTWDPAGYVAQIKATVGGLGGVQLWGPALVTLSNWWSALPQFAAVMPHLTTITAHAYPTSCFATVPTQLPSVANLLLPAASVGLADGLKPELAFAERTHRSFRVDEINTASCQGQHGIQSFASALWAIAAGFAMDRAGVNGVNIHMYPGSSDRLFGFSDANRVVDVNDQYYGWLLFGRAAPVGSRQLPSATSGNARVSAFASRTAQGTSVVLVNDSVSRGATVTLTVPRARQAVVEMLASPGLTSVGGVHFAGMAISPSSGVLSGTPQVTALAGTGRFSVQLGPASAALVQLTR